MSHEDENHMVLPWADDEPLPERSEPDPDEQYDLQVDEELRTGMSWYDVQEIAAEQRRDDLNDELINIGRTTVTDEKTISNGDVVTVSRLGGETTVLHPDGTEQSLAEFEAMKTPASWMDADPDSLADALQRRSMNRLALMRWIRESLQEGLDYGVIQTKRGPSKPSLWKSGAEKIAGMLGLRAEWPDLYDELQGLKTGATIVALRCQLIDAQGEVVSEGVGARSIEQDYGDVNKALKMAKKSGLIDAVLNAAGLSEVFSQDQTHEDDPTGTKTLDDEGIDYLYGIAAKLFPEPKAVLESLARRRFRIDDGNWKMIPDSRLGDAVRSLEQKAEAEHG